MSKNRHPRNARLYLFEKQNGRCHWCERECTWSLYMVAGRISAMAFTVDHVIPRGSGGDPKSPDNLVGACNSCNQYRNSIGTKTAAGKAITGLRSNPTLKAKLLDSMGGK